MALLHSFIAILALLASALCEEPTLLPMVPNITISKGEFHVFSGEDLMISCSVPDEPSSLWRYKWFRDEIDMEFYGSSETLIERSGDYSCQAEKDIEKWPFLLTTLPSPPLSLNVDLGWVLLKIPATPLLIDDTMILTCRIRYNFVATNVCFYKDGAEIQNHVSQQLVLHNITLNDNGVYWCRASWMQNNELHSAQSLPTPVTVLDKLNTPELEIVSDHVIEGENVNLRCKTQMNAKGEGLQIEYYYMKNNIRLAPASSSDTYIIRKLKREDAGTYTCRAKVRVLGVERWSNRLELSVN